MAKGLGKYLIDAPSDLMDSTYAVWKAEDAQIRIQMWNKMEP